MNNDLISAFLPVALLLIVGLLIGGVVVYLKRRLERIRRQKAGLILTSDQNMNNAENFGNPQTPKGKFYAKIAWAVFFLAMGYFVTSSLWNEYDNGMSGSQLRVTVGLYKLFGPKCPAVAFAVVMGLGAYASLSSIPKAYREWKASENPDA